MKNHLSRRSFIKNVGVMSLVYMTPDIINGLDCIASVLSDQSASVKTRIPTCYIGVEAFGRVLGTMLYKHNPSDLKPSYPGDLERITFLDPRRIDFYSQPFNDNLIFLAGSIMDDKFWEVRDSIISKNPKFIITTVLPEYGHTVNESILSENEFWITLPENETSRTACNIINDIYTWIDGNYEDLRELTHYLPNGTGFGFSMESTTDKSVPELRHFYDQQLNELKKSKKLHMLIFEDSKIDFRDLMDFFLVAQDEVGNNTEIFWTIFSHWDLNPKFRATILAG